MTEQELEEQTLRAFEAWRKNPNIAIESMAIGRQTTWHRCDNSSYWPRGFYYRIKPSPRLRPWTGAEGLGQKVRYKNGDQIFMITGAHRGMFRISPSDVITEWRMLQEYETLDGKPCGVLEE